jgi:Histone chaperone Rttp106-like
VPEKTQSMHNFCAFPRHALTSALAAASTSAAADSSMEPMVWTASDTLPRGAEPATPTPSATIFSALQKTGVSVIEPSKPEFASALEQAHRKGETAFHVKGFRGSKEGVLYFLGPGIVWGFKKPLLFFPFSAIESVSYTAVLQRTFNLVIVAMVGAAGDSAGGERTEELEFQMLDQADFGGIDAYVKRHGLNDASMAEARKAKRLNINGPRRGQEAEGAQTAEGAEGEEGELARAHREAETLKAQAPEHDSDDEEDDENFDPGSDGESEGSGSSDGDGDGEEEGEGGDGDGDVGDDDDDDD